MWSIDVALAVIGARLEALQVRWLVTARGRDLRQVYLADMNRGLARGCKRGGAKS